MGKKKGGGPRRPFKKDPVATMVAAGVKKTKTKAVVTHLKKMNCQNRAQTEAVDAKFSELQQLKKDKKADTPGTVQAEAERVLQSQSSKTIPASEEPNVDMATEELSKLASTMK